MLKTGRLEGEVTCDGCGKIVDLDRAKMDRSRWIRTVPYAKQPQMLVGRTSLVNRDFCGDDCLRKFCRMLEPKDILE